MNARTMEHEQAIREMAAERYLLGELTESDREAYEAHLFDCQTCFEQVKAGAEFVAGIKKAGVEEPASVASVNDGFMARFLAGLRQPVAALAIALFVIAGGFNVYQQREISRQKEAALERSYILTGIAHGGDAAKLIQAPRNSRLALSVEYTPRGEFTQYGVRIVSDSGAVKANLPISLDQADGMARIALPADSLRPGTYSVVVWGRNNDGVESEVGRGVFTLQFSD